MKSVPELQIFALEAAAAAASVLAAGADRTVNFLSADDVKLQADEDSEKLVREKLAPAGLPIIGEELGGDPALYEGNELYWVVDPLDGTYNYTRDQPATCVSIGLMRGKNPVAGVIHDFCGRRIYSGIVGEGLLVNGILHKTKWTKTDSDACIMTGFPAASDKSPEALAQFFSHVQRFKKVRMIGSAALAVAYVATGQADVYYETGTNLWDVAAGMALVLAAGGYIDLKPFGKKPLNYNLWAAGKREWIGTR